jgi:hypothetical protein
MLTLQACQCVFLPCSVALLNAAVQDKLEEPPALDQLASFILSQTGPFAASKDMDNAAFHNSILLLHIVLSHLWAELVSPSSLLRKFIDVIYNALSTAETKIGKLSLLASACLF